MNSRLSFQDVAGFATPLLTVFAVDISTGKDAEPLPALLTTSDAITSAASRILSEGEFKAALGESLLLHTPSDLKAERLLIIGLGKVKTLSVHQVRQGAGVAVRATKPRAIRELAIVLPEDHALSDEHMDALPGLLMTRALIEGAELGQVDYDNYKSDRKDTSVHLLTVLANESEQSTRSGIQAGFKEGLVYAAAQNFARALVNEPGNILTPTVLGQRTQAMCAQSGLRCEVYSTAKLQELGMGAFHAVAKGSSEPPALIVITYEPAGGAPANSPVLGLVGKGITFDTGGISIKPADGMEKMKYDMAGAAAMIGAMQAIAKLKPRNKVIAVVCSAENMPGGRAYKPGDVLTAMSGKTIEVINTDAEGRLVLADGLHYAKTLGCTHLINAATLTGACVVALGMVNAGFFTNDETAAEKFSAALIPSGEKFWRLPCTDDYCDQIASPIADIRNTGKTRYGGATNAAIFLKEFVGDTPWIHLDIAGCAWNEECKPWIAPGPSGIAVRSIIEWVRTFNK